MSWRLPARLVLICAAATWAPGTFAQTCTRASPAHTVALVELYTSEGCSSCPPADRWLSALGARFPEDRVAPLALHVDYWDYIGWQDPYARAAFTDRQRRLGQLSGTSTIYTPEVFVGMRELRGWHDADTFGRRVAQINARPARAAITVSLATADDRAATLDAAFDVAHTEAAQSLRGVVALHESGLVSDVRRGENSGVRLHHDRVVRRWLQAPLAIGAGTAHLRETLVLPAHWNAANLGVTAFVEDVRSGEVLQAVSLARCAPEPR